MFKYPSKSAIFFCSIFIFLFCNEKRGKRCQVTQTCQPHLINTGCFVGISGMGEFFTPIRITIAQGCHLGEECHDNIMD